MKYWFALVLFVSATAAPAFACGSASHSANGTVHHHDRRDIARRAAMMPMKDAVAIAMKRVPGTVLAAGIETNDGIRTYQIDVLPGAGATVRMWLNASNGEILKMTER